MIRYPYTGDATWASYCSSSRGWSGSRCVLCLCPAGGHRHLCHSRSALSVRMTKNSASAVRPHEYTQSGKGHFLACPPSWWWSKVVVYALAERADKLPLFLLYPYMYPVVRTPEMPSLLQLGRNWDKSLKSLPTCYSQSPPLTDFTPNPPTLWAKVVWNC